MKMIVTILNGDMGPGGSDFSGYLEKLADKFRENQSVTIYPLNQMNIRFCTGCWNCWWKTPGRCATTDDAEMIFKSVINSDFVIFASPLMAGFTSSSLKKITDRLIVILHPYSKILNGEIHHEKRYDVYPDIGLILEKEKDTDIVDIDIVNSIYDRFAINFHTERRFTKFIHDSKIEDIVNETCNI